MVGGANSADVILTSGYVKMYGMAYKHFADYIFKLIAYLPFYVGYLMLDNLKKYADMG